MLEITVQKNFDITGWFVCSLSWGGGGEVGKNFDALLASVWEVGRSQIFRMYKKENPTLFLFSVLRGGVYVDWTGVYTEKISLSVTHSQLHSHPDPNTFHSNKAR